jgi:hypothetical protein
VRPDDRRPGSGSRSGSGSGSDFCSRPSSSRVCRTSKCSAARKSRGEA